jgi:hypothetical protein
MNYDDWKLETPPNNGETLTFETKTKRISKSLEDLS